MGGISDRGPPRSVGAAPGARGHSFRVLSNMVEGRFPWRGCRRALSPWRNPQWRRGGLASSIRAFPLDGVLGRDAEAVCTDSLRRILQSRPSPAPVCPLYLAVFAAATCSRRRCCDDLRAGELYACTLLVLRRHGVCPARGHFVTESTPCGGRTNVDVSVRAIPRLLSGSDSIGLISDPGRAEGPPASLKSSLGRVEKGSPRRIRLLIPPHLLFMIAAVAERTIESMISPFVCSPCRSRSVGASLGFLRWLLFSCLHKPLGRRFYGSGIIALGWVRAPRRGEPESFMCSSIL